MNLEIKSSGPLRVAYFECGENPLTLENEECRREVFEKLKVEEKVERVVLAAPITTIYDSPEISNLARTFAMAQRLALDKVMYGWSDEKKCKKCVEERMRALTEMLDHLIANPHEFQNLRTLLVKAQKEAKGDCKGCTAYNFGKLIGMIEKMLAGHPVLKKLKPGKYDEAFAAIQKPFFVEGVWISPPPGSKLVEEYPLKDDRGKVRIYERPENPVLFYELDLPEFKIPQEHLRLLYRWRLPRPTRGSPTARGCNRSRKSGMMSSCTC
ncbi:MAG: hypothetical protein QXG38_02845 [Candidatus Hadarchaeales archaeon]